MTTMQKITAEVAEANRVPVREIMEPGRRRDIAWARQEAMLRCHDELGKSLRQIAATFEHHHTTVLYGINRARERRA